MHRDLIGGLGARGWGYRPNNLCAAIGVTFKPISWGLYVGRNVLSSLLQSWLIIK